METENTNREQMKLARIRFGLIAPLIQGTYPDESMSAYCRRVAACAVKGMVKEWLSKNEYESGDLLRFVLILPSRMWKFMQAYAKIGPKGYLLETLIIARKNKDMQGKETICNEK